jgi:hypothetical protein
MWVFTASANESDLEVKFNLEILLRDLLVEAVGMWLSYFQQVNFFKQGNCTATEGIHREK